PGAPAQPAGPTNLALKPEPSQADWVKVCNKDPSGKELCFTTRDFVTDQGQPVLAIAVYEVKGDPNRVMRLMLPEGFLIQPGVRFSVDNGKADSGRFQICMNACFAEAQVNDATFGQIKKGTTMNVTVQNQFAREITFQAPLAGFARAFDGPPIDPKVLEAQQKQLQEQTPKQAGEKRQKPGSQGGAARGASRAAPCPAPAATAAPARRENRATTARMA
ncbi:invasion associated locus B family protein, partial [Nostoc sp. NIES-2111]